MPGELSRTYDGPRDPGEDWPLWIGDAANDILEQLPDWVEETGQKPAAVGEQQLLGRIEQAIVARWRERER